ncbi:nucleotide sugar dehydrogenase [Pelagibaculum spongiae]|uniref:Vi polysaccharide biosynthesis protein VipA/TviB n=1 Tax=Pelagibaculum spongiae TaxID=2080658 RepID=A0A2V1H1N1_9GAMM|nr:nucleotide sugar dehydrogenase [Pelagibaculum spongiae]PVZ70291.1 Vi polysaccharide biosynthesis protein VipA/TviB [Pelagibaculum spongiae]
MQFKDDPVIAVIGLGYVGLPLALAFGEHYQTLGFDLRDERVKALLDGYDETEEVSARDIAKANYLSLTGQLGDLKRADIYIVTVPTPIDDSRRPDMSALKFACSMLAGYLEKNNVVVFESTVYPGATEEICIPILQKKSSLTLNEDLFVGYSPERINPGDKKNQLKNICKITSGSSPESAIYIDQIYQSVLIAKTYRAPSIKVAEAAKVIENTQRDVNIALMNELLVILDKLNIDAGEVLQAARTKWNFLPFTPGLVGGHCIGVDPYYLIYKAEQHGYYPQIITGARQVNDCMAEYIASRVVKKMLKRKMHVEGGSVLLMGLAFKENCKDIRNSKTIDVIRNLEEYGLQVDVYDPLVDKQDADKRFSIELYSKLPKKQYDVILTVVPHSCFENDPDVQNLLRQHQNRIIYQVKSG